MWCCPLRESRGASWTWVSTWNYMDYMGMGVEPKIMGKPPQIIHLFIGFSLINHPFWGGNVPPIFGNTRILVPK